MFLSLCMIFTFGILGGILFEKIKLPKLIWYLVLGICLGPSLFNLVDSNLLRISSYLRQIALVIILTLWVILRFKDVKTDWQTCRAAMLCSCMLRNGWRCHFCTYIFTYFLFGGPATWKCFGCSISGYCRS